MLCIMLTFLCPFTSKNIEPHVYPRKHKSDLGDNLSNFSREQCIFVDTLEKTLLGFLSGQFYNAICNIAF